MTGLLTLIALAPLCAQAPVGPGGLPARPSQVVSTPFDYAAADADTLDERAQKLSEELEEATSALSTAPHYHPQESTYLKVAPFNEHANAALNEHLRERLAALGPLVTGDRTDIIAAEETLDETVARRFACAQHCGRFDDAITIAREQIREAERVYLARINAAALETEIILLQLDYLDRARLVSAVRVRRSPDHTETERLFERRELDPNVPEFLLAERDARLEQAEKEAEDARQREQLLDSIGSACAARDERLRFQATYNSRREEELSTAAQLEQQIEQVRSTKQAYQTKIERLVTALDAGEDVHPEFDLLHVEFTQQDDALRTEQEAARERLGESKVALEDARNAEKRAEAEVPVLSVIEDPTDPCSPEGKLLDGALERAQFAAGIAQVTQEQARVRRLEEQLKVAALRLALAEHRVADIREHIHGVLPYLSEEYQEEVFQYNAVFFQKLGYKLGFLIRDTYEHLKSRIGQFDAFRFFSWRGFTGTFAFLIWLALIWIVGRFATERWPTWIVETWEWTKGLRVFQSALEQLHSLLKLVSVGSREAIVLATAWAFAAYIGWSHIEVQALWMGVKWWMAYRILVNMAQVLVQGPNWAPHQTGILRGALDNNALFPREAELAQLSFRSLRWVIRYFVVTYATLACVEPLLGQDYLYHLLIDVMVLVQLVLIGYLHVLWRGSIVEAYLRSGLPYLRNVIVRYQQSLWLSPLTLVITVTLAVHAGWPWAQEFFRGAGPLQWITNFRSRRKMEQAAQARQELDRDKTGQLRLPKTYVKFFARRALTDETYVIAPCTPVQKIVHLYGLWTKEKREGSVAIIGGAGMGKTTLINQVLRALPIEEDTVLRGQLDRKLATESDVIHFLSDVFGFKKKPTNLHDLEQAILADKNPVVVIDDAHHFFLKTMGGLVGMDAFVHVVNVTSANVFWITAFDAYPWFFIKNLKRSEPPFRHIVHLKPWTTEDLEGLLMSRSHAAGYTTTFQDLVIDRGTGDRAQYEVVRTARSYFRLLGELADGNPSVAIRYWLAALRPKHRGSRVLRVGLYSPGTPKALLSASDDVLFLLTCIAEHSSLTPEQLSEILRTTEDAVHRMLSYCEQNNLVHQSSNGVVVLDLEHYREIISTLSMRGFVYF